MTDNLPDGAFIPRATLADMVERMDPKLKAKLTEGGAVTIELANLVTAKIEKRGIPLSFSWEQLAGASERRPGHVEVTAKSAKWLTEREAFQRQWEKLNKLGLEQGFLEQEIGRAHV